MKKFKSEKGITLVALVITVIVMIILIGVTVASSVGDNGAIEEAKKVTKDSDIGVAKEEIGAAIAGLEKNGKIRKTDLEIVLQKYGTIQYDEVGNPKGIVTKSDNEILLKDIWNGQIVDQ